MKERNRVRGLLAQKLENQAFRERFDEGFEALGLEVQILTALEAKNWTFSRLAEETNTSKSNVSRDLSGGGILSASLARIRRISEALGMRLVMLLIPKEQAHFIVPQLEDIARSSVNAAHGGIPVTPAAAAPIGRFTTTVNAATYFTKTEAGSSESFRIGIPVGAER